MALTNDLAEGVFDPKPGGSPTPIFGTGTPTYVIGPDPSNMFKDIYVDSSNRPGALIASWIRGEITFEELKAAIPNEEFRNSLLGQFGYNPEGNLIDVVGEPVIGPATVTGVKPEPETGEKTETELAPEDSGEEPVNEIQKAIDAIQEKFPTWEDLWGKIKNQLPSDPKEWGDAIRGILEASGIQLPSGDVWDILKGGYGVTTQIDPTWGGISGIFDPNNLLVFVPGIPVGLPPSSTIIGSIEDLVTDPVGTITDKVQSVLGDIVTDPGGFIEQILTGSLEVPPEIWDMILGGVAVGQDLYDWLIESGVETKETTPMPSLGGTEDEGGTEDGGKEASIFTDTTETEPTDRLSFGYVDPLTAEGEITEVVTDGGEDISDDRSPLVFGYEFPLTDTSDTAEIGSSPITGAAPEETPISGSSGGAGGGGGGGAAGTSEDFLRGLSYRPLQVAPVAARPVVDYTAGLFTQPTSRMGNLQLGNITAGLFGDMIG